MAILIIFHDKMAMDIEYLNIYSVEQHGNAQTQSYYRAIVNQT